MSYESAQHTKAVDGSDLCTMPQARSAKRKTKGEATSYTTNALSGQGASASLSPAGVSEYIYIPTAQGPMPIAAEIDGRLHAVHTDQLNTPRQLTDANGNKVWQWAISGFGEVEATTAQTGWIRGRNGSAGQRSNTLPVTFSQRFPGQQFDEESGLHYNHHRYYDPYLTVGYTEADPLGLSAGWNRFVYVDGDPLGAVDPSGENPMAWGVAVGLVVAGYFLYQFLEFKECTTECAVSTNHPLKDEPDYQCKPPRDDGWMWPFYSCLAFCELSAAPGFPSALRREKREIFMLE